MYIKESSSPTIAKSPVTLIVVFVWIGFVCAISFMEAWLKFRAPGITLALGLGIGRLVFAALNKVEWVLVIAAFAGMLLSRQRVSTFSGLGLFIPLILLCIQTIWLLPSLDIRAIMHMEGRVVPPSNLHFYYVAIEAVKIICLSLFGMSLFKTRIQA